MSTERTSSGPGLRPGTQVRVTSGTFASMVGVVVDAPAATALSKKLAAAHPVADAPMLPPSPQGLVWIALEIFGRLVPVELELAQLERYESTP
jgi:transcription antitermination factor NusG